jgi:hypothetical protein
MGMGNPTEGVLYAGAILGNNNAYSPPIGHPAITVGHVHRCSLAAGHNGLDSGNGGLLNQRVGWIAKYILSSFHV